VVHGPGGEVEGAPLVARLPSGERVGDRAVSSALAAELSGTSLVGRQVRLRRDGERTSYEPS
jgi:hypothetical protein